MGVVEVRGAEQFRAVGRELRAAGLEGKELRRELLRNLRVAGQPLTEEAKRAAVSSLPKSGGLNLWVADSKFSVRNQLSGRNVGMRIRGTKKGHSVGSSDELGRVRHPVFGHRDRWTETKTDKGWFTRAMSGRAATAVQLAALVALRNVRNKIEKG